MKIRAGYEISYDCPQPTPMILMLSIHPSRTPDLLSCDHMRVNPIIPVKAYHDSFGNFCQVIRAPAGRLTMSTDFLVQDNGEPDTIAPRAEPQALEIAGGGPDLSSRQPVLRDRSPVGDGFVPFRACSEGVAARESDLRLRPRSHHVRLRARRPTKTAWDAHTERRGVCRDFAHLAVTLCRCMNVPARYCTGYLGDIGVPPDDAPMDFSAWFEAYLGGRWYTFDARHNKPRIGRILMARGRDATDVAIVTSFGPCTLAGFKVITDEVTSAPSAST